MMHRRFSALIAISLAVVLLAVFSFAAFADSVFFGFDEGLEGWVLSGYGEWGASSWATDVIGINATSTNPVSYHIFADYALSEKITDLSFRVWSWPVGGTGNYSYQVDVIDSSGTPHNVVVCSTPTCLTYYSYQYTFDINVGPGHTGVFDTDVDWSDFDEYWPYTLRVRWYQQRSPGVSNYPPVIDYISLDYFGEDPTPTPEPEVQCILDYADFEGGTDGWSYTGSVISSTSVITLESVDSQVWQVLTDTLSAGKYTIYGTVPPGNYPYSSLQIYLGDYDTGVIPLNQSVSESHYFTETVTVGSDFSELRIKHRGFYPAALDYVCFESEIEDSTVCIQPPYNGSFNSAADWTWADGIASWSSSEGAAYIEAAEDSDPHLSQGFEVFPIESGYWVLSFDAKSDYAGGWLSIDSATIQGFGSGTSNGIVELGTSWQRYDFDVTPPSPSESADVTINFSNMLTTTGFSGGEYVEVTSESAVLVDNVCLHWSDEVSDWPPPEGPPQLRPIEPPSYTHVTTFTLGTECVTCSEVVPDGTCIEGWTIPGFSGSIGYTWPGTASDWYDLGAWLRWVWGVIHDELLIPLLCFLIAAFTKLFEVFTSVINYFIDIWTGWTVAFFEALNYVIAVFLNPFIEYLYAIWRLFLDFVRDPWGTFIGVIWPNVWGAVKDFFTFIFGPLLSLWDDVVWPLIQPYMELLIDIYNWLTGYSENPIDGVLQPLWDIIYAIEYLFGKVVYVVVAFTQPFIWFWGWLSVVFSGMSSEQSVYPTMPVDMTAFFDAVSMFMSFGYIHWLFVVIGVFLNAIFLLSILKMYSRG